ncbi:sodium-dependent phosphate transport protein 3 isoform X1 [Sigmodon hispidus]
MSSAFSTKRIIQISSCSICKELMSHPVSINCGHSYCKSCIESYHNKVSPMTEMKTMLGCPLCRNPFNLENLRPNQELENIIDIIKETEKKDHEMLCEKHREKLDLFCEDESELLCWRCNHEAQHKGHSVVLMEDVYQGYKEKLQEMVTKLNELQEDYKIQKRLMTEEINAWKDAIKNQRQRIQSNFKNLQRFLHEEEKSYLWRLENEEGQVLRKLKDIEDNQQQKSEELESQIREMEEKCQGSAYKILQDVKNTLSSSYLIKLVCLYSGVCSLRYGLALIMHFSNFTMITQRVSLSIAIIAMVNSTQHQDPANASIEGPLTDPLSNWSRSVKDFSTRAAVYQWSPETQGIIFSSISYGIILTLIPSGYLAGILGAKQIIGAGLLISSLLTLFTPLAADFGVILVIVIRTVQGMAQGMAWTGQFTIWAKWAPPLERSKLTSIAGSGAAFGSFIILFVGGLISQALGWPFIFYIFGSIGCVCCVLWFTVIYDDPMHHPCISGREKEHITSSLAQQSGSPRRSIPIKAMVRCLPLWAIFMGFFSHFWLCTIIITYLPTYISTVLHVNIRDHGIVESGVLSSLPFIAASSCTILGGQMADFLLSKNLLSLITVRKLFSSLGLLLPSLCAVALPFLTSSYITTIVLLILIPGTSNLCDSGFIINTLDVAPRYASFLMGISRGFGLTAGIISSTTTGFLISQMEDSESGWRNVFFLSAAVNMFGLIFYLMFGQAEIQNWAKERTLTRL